MPPGEGILALDDLSSLEDRHRSLSFEEAREAVLAGEDDGWRVLVEKYSRFIYSVALRLLRGVENREEQAQEIYCRVFSQIQRNDYQVLRQFESRCKFTTYLFRMVQTARSTAIRQETRETGRMDFVDFCDEANRGIEAIVADRMDSEQTLPGLSPEKLRDEIVRALDGLSPREKLLLKLRFQKGLKLRELPDVLGYRDTNDAAYALRKALKQFEPLAALEEGEWGEEDLKTVLNVLDLELFQ